MIAWAAGHAAGGADRLRWRAHLLVLAGLWAGLLGCFARDVGDIAAIWWNSSTFGHCLFLPPLIAWLVWQRRGGMARIAPRGWPPGLAVVAAGALCWLLGAAAEVGVARHFGLVVMAQGAVPAVLGPAAARGLAFPLGYAIFLVPMGEGLVPPLQTLTARMCLGLLHLARVPATLDGVFIATPAGWFEVAEACSGAKFLLAMAAYAVFAAHVCFRRWPRRIAFVGAALVAPVLANGVRAFATIWVAGRTSIAFAGGFDHVVYGWLFFALVIALLLAGAWPWFDRGPRDPWIDPAAIDPHPRPRDPRRALAVAAAAWGIAAAVAAWAAIAPGPMPPAAPIALPFVPGWMRVPPDTHAPWIPSYAGADARVAGRYRDAAGRTVDLALIVYLRQEGPRELVRTGQGAAGAAWLWSADLPAPAGGRAERLVGPGRLGRIALSFYRIGNVTTGSDMRVKIETLRARLLGGPPRAAAVIVSAPEPGGRAAADAFLRDLGPVARLVDPLPASVGGSR